MAGVRVTRGRLTALWLVLRTLEKLDGQAEGSDVRLAARRSGLRGGQLPVPDGVRLGRVGSFMRESAGILALAPRGERALTMCDRDEPSTEVLKYFFSVLVLASPPAWVAWWQGAPGSLDEVVPEGERQVMRDTGLLPRPEPADPIGWAWWQALEQIPLPEETAVRRRALEEAGEELSLRYEQWRLTEEGHPDLAAGVRWVARESPAYGFDLLSFAGESIPGRAADDPVAITVRSTGLPRSETFPMLLQAHEWLIASGLGERHLLHLWNAVQPGNPPRSRPEQPLVLPGSALRSHLPLAPSCSDGDSCAWQTASVRLKVPPVGAQE